MQVHWLWLNSRYGIGPRTALKLLSHFPSLESLYMAGRADFAPLIQKSAVLDSLLDKDLSRLQQLLDKCARTGIRVITLEDADYPKRLRAIPDPPLVLYYRGTLPDFDGLAALGMVGTRKATRYGLETAERLGREIAVAGGLVVSGLADGIDAAAMHGALRAGYGAVGVLGCGVDVVYPAGNRELYAATEARGCIISEFAPGTAPNASNFPRRNRIISGLSCGVIVVEAPLKSGALITASYALEQGRDVFAVPGNVDNPACAGTLKLIREGAAVAVSGSEIMSEYSAAFRAAKPSPIREIPARAPAEREIIPVEKKKVDKPDKKPYSDKHKALPELMPDEKAVCACLNQEKKHVDTLIFESGLPAPRVLSALTMLLVKGIIRQYPGKYYSLA